LPRPPAHRPKHRQQNRAQNGDDGQHNEHFYQRKSGAFHANIRHALYQADAALRSVAFKFRRNFPRIIMGDSIFRYHYPEWPGKMDGERMASELGTFDFSHLEVSARLEKEREEQRGELHISVSRQTTFAVLEKIIVAVELMPQLEVV